MKILLLGEYSNVHYTLAQGLRTLGHEVTVASDGDHWKNYLRDIDTSRKSKNKLGGIRYLLKLRRLLPLFKGYDVVQLINPIFFDLKAERILPFYKYIRKNNKSVFMGAYGMDRYWVKAGVECNTFRYSDFNFGNKVRYEGDNCIWITDWLEGKKGDLNTFIANDCDGIVAGLYEYYASYKKEFQNKLTFIPFPIDLSSVTPIVERNDDKIVFFVGVQKGRSAYKGTDVMLKALKQIKQKYPSDCEVVKVESVPFKEYQSLMNQSDVLLDQLYSYTPAMNALLAMAKGLVVLSGGEPENYEILNELELRPIINTQPNEKSVFEELEKLLQHKERLPLLKAQSLEYIQRHHDHIKVAQQYLNFWKKKTE